ncbi:MAG: hypothetical protein MJ110_02430 [Lachnospiraceae bacterium]|nr:hypothetical protein [Lachnospiraceae bacterium]
MNKYKVAFAIAAVTMVMGMCTGCGETTEDTAFGLQDFEGFYCMTSTEEIDGFEVTYTTGYQFNGDGTGMCYAQDIVPFTWNETEIHFGDNTENFVMEPGKLTVGDITYDKIDGKLITPNPYVVDVDNIENGSYYVYIDQSGISEEEDRAVIRAEIYTEDTYDIVDINSMAVGDVLFIKGQLFLVNSINKNDLGLIEVNGGVEYGGSALIAVDESNCYVYAGMDLDRSYTRQGIASLEVSENVKLTDSYDPTEDKEYEGADAVNALKEIVEQYPLTSYDGMITVEDGVIVNIHRLYVP